MKINSSNVTDVDYDSRTKRLTVEFSGGRKYVYKNVSYQRFNAFLNSDSLGSYVNEKLSNLSYERIK